ncbi:MAG TPA: ATP-binding cassette domain-containing protein [Chloroflexota bacterium]|nr:ATP-binding cassette domain-containing protein [Chloroflexota bacterium]
MSMQGAGAAPVTTGPLLQVKQLTKSFGAVQVLRGVSFEAAAGEVTALLGDNGAGKSTLIKCVAGTHVPDGGQILLGDVPQNFRTPSDATHAGIETVYQDLALADNLDVVANLFLGREYTRTLIPGVVRTINEEGMELRAREALSTLRINIPSVRSLVAQLSGGQRQSIAVAKAVLWSPRVVILDEPTAALGVAQTRQVLDLVLRLRERGLAVIVITHNMHDVFEVADRASVMRLGRRVARFNIKEVTPDDVVAAITGARAFDTADVG